MNRHQLIGQFQEFNHKESKMKIEEKMKQLKEYKKRFTSVNSESILNNIGI